MIIKDFFEKFPSLKNLFFCLWLGILLLTSSISHAILIEKDFLSDGDNLITHDTVNGLEWLDVRATRSWSYYNVINSGYVNDYGFHLAREGEIINFLQTNIAGYDINKSYYYGDDWQMIGEIVRLMGVTDSGSGHYGFEAGYDKIVGDRLAEFRLHYFSSLGYINDNITQPLDSRIWQRGFFLVRNSPSPVPEPSTVYLLGVGLIGFVTIRKKLKT